MNITSFGVVIPEISTVISFGKSCGKASTVTTSLISCTLHNPSLSTDDSPTTTTATSVVTFSFLLTAKKSIWST